MDQISKATTPKLSLYSLPSQGSEARGSESPPLRRTSASVPFLWEEAPGKPRRTSNAVITEPAHRHQETTSSRSLGLPPRLARFTKMPSPTTVLDGPDHVGRAHSFRSPEGMRSKGERGIAYFGSARWGSFRKPRRNFGGGSFDISSWGVTDVDSCGGAGSQSEGHDHHCDVKVKTGNKNHIYGVTRKSSFFTRSNPNNFLANIYEGFKQVVPWKRKQEKPRKIGT